ncbi:lipopolysaccharide transport system ATP-binding protein [Rhodopirellula rubra]|uniref:Lipopolysaccharide transport system ATP-binding protein n=1 Tax=Aporhodopirellula rubra TaxID=980271 RepID=A0A7W5H3G3_9BACT|nr:ABC transporter ATP-binding protein [Aporhodopirellula rubra]MBB3204279.1 lipopolysaccharide transport system ATP-binding protein [Aporhodopirellula rubra]
MLNAIQLENVGKVYRLGEIGSSTISGDLSRVWARLRKKPDPLAQVGVVNERERVGGESVWALKDISLTVPRGTILGIVGRNGAGKSTLLKLLSRITAPSTGTIRMKGRIASLLEVGTGFHPELTGRENVYLNGAILGMTRQEITRKLDEIVEFSGCAKYLDTPVKRYSSGMTVRLGFAVAAYLECEILVVDEVLAVGDAEFQRKCIGRMQDVAHSGRTVLFVSHNMGSVETLCTDAIAIHAGQLIDSGKPQAVIERYLNSHSEETVSRLLSGKTSHIKSFRLCDSEGDERSSFFVGDTIVFEAELSAHPSVQEPRFGFVISKSGVGRIATLHTDIQYNERWQVEGRTRVRAVWRDVPLNVGEYRVDASLWGFDRELETLLGCGQFSLEMRDVYGTGLLPDPSFQGHVLPRARWEIDNTLS